MLWPHGGHPSKAQAFNLGLERRPLSDHRAIRWATLSLVRYGPLIESERVGESDDAIIIIHSL